MYRCPQADILHPVSHTQSQACQKQHWSRGATYWCALLARVGRQRNTLLLHVRASQESAEPTKSVLNPDLETRGARRRSQRSPAAVPRQAPCTGPVAAQPSSHQLRLSPPSTGGRAHSILPAVVLFTGLPACAEQVATQPVATASSFRSATCHQERQYRQPCSEVSASVGWRRAHTLTGSHVLRLTHCQTALTACTAAAPSQQSRHPRSRDIFTAVKASTWISGFCRSGLALVFQGYKGLIESHREGLQLVQRLLQGGHLARLGADLLQGGAHDRLVQPRGTLRAGCNGQRMSTP